MTTEDDGTRLDGGAEMAKQVAGETAVYDENFVTTDKPETSELMRWLKPVLDPELFLSLVELGLIYDVVRDEKSHAAVTMTLTSPGCPAGDYMVHQIISRLKEHPAVETAGVEIVWEPKWDPKMMASEEAREELGIW